ncbi:MAG: hypothetical protein DI533_00885 [Cereibacter sphaeroides]|uniref:Uncharacterized protein n=1 Tax=Cereibacter sphaeroides TaxID=1063 RepID=A0A2W5S8A8_CERSP|nr:MAG: hypothetical protein DI533_00885 [Cereibacter sphaeroides]
MAETGYGASRSSLRETLKWLTTVLTALGAALAAGATVSGLGGLSVDDRQDAMWGGGIAMVAILIAIAILVRLLTVSPFYLDDLLADTRLTAEIEKRKLEVLAPGTNTVANLKKKLQDAVRDVAARPDDEPTKAIYRAVSTEANQVVDLAAFLSLAKKVRCGMIWLGLLALIAFGGLAWFGYVIGRAAAAKPAPVAAVLQPGAGWAEVAAALSKECGDGPFAVTLAAQTGLTKGWTTTVTAPRCAGVAVTVPEALVTVTKP